MPNQTDDNLTQTRLVLIPAGLTNWEVQNRIVGNADIPLNEQGIEQSHRWAEQLKDEGLDAIYSPLAEAARETANVIASGLNIKVRTDKLLCEIDMGLWQGIQITDIKTRHPKVYKKWIDEPETVIPPNGEGLEEVRQRIEKSLSRIIKKHPGKRVAVVLGQSAFALARIEHEGKTVKQFWEVLNEPLTWHEYAIGELSNN